MTEKKLTITHMPHHVQQKLCQTRLPYRQGKKLTAVKSTSSGRGTQYQVILRPDEVDCNVHETFTWWKPAKLRRIMKKTTMKDSKVYTINDESQHLLLCGVPKIQLGEEVGKLVCPYGDIKEIQLVTEYPSEDFTETYHIHYAHIQSARIAKRLIDNKNFFGGVLHVFYIPELETLAETRAKLLQRRKDVATHIRRNQRDITNPEVDKFIPKEQYHRKKKNPALPLTEERLQHCYPGETLSSICNGIPQDIDPRFVTEPSLPSGSESLSIPYQSTEAIIQTGTRRPNVNSESNPRKRKNYRGHCIDDNVKVKIVRPRLIDTRNIAKSDSTEKTNIFRNIKKIESGITIKLLEKSVNKKKKILIKNPNVTHLVQPSKDLQISIEAAKSQIRSVMQKHST